MSSVLDRTGLDALIEALVARGFTVIGPTVRDSAIVLAELRSGADLPSGVGVDVGPGSYRLTQRSDRAVFAHSAGPQSWKQYLHPSRQQLWSIDADGGFIPPASEPVRYAFLGVRGCDLAAIGKLTRVLGGGPHPDGAFSRRRNAVFVIAVGCTEPGGLCFCASMGTGPAPGPGYDLALTERIVDGTHTFVVEVGTDDGAAVLADVEHRAASEAEVAEAGAAVAEAALHMGRHLNAATVKDLLRDNRESPVWQDVADRCLTCGNCTMACPTCFCTTTEDVSDLTGEHVERTERWASCFELDFSYLHGGSVRTTGESRYRHWISHKLSTWYDQFGSSGCVGCGRCIAWCPVGIDITEEVAKIEAGADARAGADGNG